MSHTAKRRVARKTRQKRVRAKIRGTEERPRLCVSRSLRYITAQLISDDTGTVIDSASSKGSDKSGSVEGAKVVGQRIAELAKEKNISSVVFDRNGYLYHGRVAAVAEGAREGGLSF